MFAPALLLTVTIEAGTGQDDERADVHLHAGGQGFWIARQLAALGTHVAMCTTFGGETGAIVRMLVEDVGVVTRAVASRQANGAYVHDRRSGAREEIAAMPPGGLSRHELDELYGATLVEALEADVTVLGGTGASGVLPADTYRRLCHDLRANGRTVVADLSGPELAAALDGGLSAVKVSDEEMVADGRVAADHSVDELVAAMRAMAGADAVIVTRGEAQTLALVDGEVLAASSPALEPIDHRGAGDSLTAGVAAGLAAGRSVRDALGLGVAAGALNVTRRGLASGERAEIERMARFVRVEPLDEASASRRTNAGTTSNAAGR